MGIAPFARFPHIMLDGDNISPALILQTLNPPKMYSVDMQTVYGVHKCIGVASEGRLDTREGKFRVVALKPKRKPRAKTGAA